MQQIDSMDGLFHDGNPATGELGTIVTASWLNSVQGELANLVTGLGGTLDTGKHDQLKTLLSAALDSKAAKAATLAGYGIGDAAPKHNAALTGTPTAPTAPAGTATSQLATTGFVADALANNAGLPLLFPLWCPNRAAIPAGYAPADGQTLARSLYPDAWAGIAAGNVPTVANATWLATPTERGKFTAGDGATTFRLPDYNGKAAGSLGALFMRGDGAMSAGADGVIQGDAIRNITGMAGKVVSYGEETGPFYKVASGTGYELTSQSQASRVGFDASRIVPTANENRPLNVTGCWAIRLFGTVTNPGAADAAQLATEVAKLGAQKLDAAAAFGVGQSPQSVTRTSGTTYYNTTGKLIWVSATSGLAAGGQFSLFVDGVARSSASNSGTGTATFEVCWFVPAGSSYVINSTTTTIYANEFR